MRTSTGTYQRHLAARRLARAAATTVAVGAFVVGAASAAAADTPQTWTEPEPRPILETLGLFVGLPVGLFLLIALLVFAGASRRGPRYRPDQEWSGESAWFGAPEAERAPERAAVETGAPSTGGGASGSW